MLRPFWRTCSMSHEIAKLDDAELLKEWTQKWAELGDEFEAKVRELEGLE